MKIFTLLQSVIDAISLQTSYLFRSSSRFKSGVEKYPDVISGKSAGDLFGNYRGYLRNDLSRCSGCGLCLPTCPVGALTMDTENRTDGSIGVKSFRIHLGKCFACAACVDVCPEKSLSHSRDFELVSARAENLVVVFHGDEERRDLDTTRIRTYEVRR